MSWSACRYGLPDDSDEDEAPSKPATGSRDKPLPSAGVPRQEPEEEGMQLSEAFASYSTHLHV